MRVLALLILFSSILPSGSFAGVCRNSHRSIDFTKLTSTEWTSFIKSELAKVKEENRVPADLPASRLGGIPLRAAPHGVRFRTEAGTLNTAPHKSQIFSKTESIQDGLKVEHYNTAWTEGVPLHDLSVLWSLSSHEKELAHEAADYLNPMNPMSPEKRDNYERRFHELAQNPNHPLAKTIRNQVAATTEKREELLTEILLHVLPDYVKRRGWDSADKVVEFIRDAKLSLDNTVYTVIRSPEHNRILGIIGLTFAAYGAVRVHGPSGSRLVYGPFGSTFESIHGYSLRSPDQIKSFVENPGSLPPLPRLPTETVFNESLKRPVTEDGVLPGTITLSNGERIEPVVFKGLISEPVKFWADHGLLKNKNTTQHAQTLKALVQQLISHVLFIPDRALVSHRAYGIYTYGDPLSVRLYRHMGLRPLNIQKNQIGREWTVIGLTPEELEGRLGLEQNAIRDVDQVIQAVTEYYSARP